MSNRNKIANQQKPSIFGRIDLAKWTSMPVLSAVTFLLTLLLTAGLHEEYVRQTAELNPFQPTDVFWQQSLEHAGGRLGYYARFLASLFYQPWLGAAVLGLLLVLIPWVMKRVFNVSKSLSPLCFIPSFLLLLNYTQQGYLIYVLKAPAPAFTAPLGLLCTLVLYGLYRAFSSWWVHLIIYALLIFSGYPAIGFFALLTMALCIISDIVAFVKTRSWETLGVAFLAFLSMVLAPRWFAVQKMTAIQLDSIFIDPLPDYFWLGDERLMWIPVAVALLTTAVLSLVGEKAGGKLHVFSLILFVAAVIATCKYTYNDPNYTNILKMSQAADRAAWKEIKQIADESEVAPTRLEVLFRNLALQKMGIAGDCMFQYPDGDTPYNCPRQHQFLRLIGARALYYYYGKVNFSYRWCMEDLVEYGMRPSYLEYLTRGAIVNKEPELTQKYLTALNNIPLRHYTIADLTENGKDIAMPITSLMNYNNLLDGDGGLIEVYLLNTFAMTEGGSKEMTELSLQDNLILKQIDGFWPQFIRLLPTFGDRIPTHYQEAAVLFAALEQKYDISQLAIDPKIRERFERLVNESSQYSNLDDETNGERLRPSFGDTYWFYYFFVKGLKTN